MGYVAKRWLVYAFTYEQGVAMSGVVRAVDPADATEELDLKVSDRDFDVLDDWLMWSGYRSDWVHRIHGNVIDHAVWVEATKDPAVPFEWVFEDPVEVVHRRAL